MQEANYKILPSSFFFKAWESNHKFQDIYLASKSLNKNI